MKWGSILVVETSFYRLDVSWLRESTVRELLVHILAEKKSGHGWQERAIYGTLAYVPYVPLLPWMPGGGGKIDPIMLSMYNLVLPICDTCKVMDPKLLLAATHIM